MLELIIERSMQILQTTEGEKLPRVIETCVRQKMSEPGTCQFTMWVNQPGLCRYDDRQRSLRTPAGNLLRFVTVHKHRPGANTLEPDMILCESPVAFHHDTKHRAHYPAPTASAN